MWSAAAYKYCKQYCLIFDIFAAVISKYHKLYQSRKGERDALYIKRRLLDVLSVAYGLRNFKLGHIVELW